MPVARPGWRYRRPGNSRVWLALVAQALLAVGAVEAGTVDEIRAGGVTLEGDWKYARGVRPLPVLWMRDSSGRCHTTRTNGVSPM